MNTSESKFSVEKKWGEAAKAGFSQVPDTLFKAQHALGITPTEMVVLLNINTAWWKAGEIPFPSMAGIARRMGVQPRTVERAISSLVKKGLILKTRISGKRGVRSQFDLSPLVARVEGLAKRDPYYLAGQVHER